VGGILLINKPAKITSHDVVVQIRRLFRTKKVGHAGALDPFATGLLILCLDEATRIVDYLVNRDKEYVTVMKLGESTDTQDCTGRVLEKREVPAFSNEDIADVFARFVGDLSQIPPMFSARKVQGKRLYEFAREGQTVARTARSVRIETLEILEVRLPFIRFRVVCSKGTYIRTLAHDIGALLGCGAYLSALERTRIGQFFLKDAVALEQLAHIVQYSDKTRVLIPLDAALAFLPAIEVSEAASRLLVHGTQISLTAENFTSLGDGDNRREADQEIRVYNSRGKFIALARQTFTGTPTSPQWMVQPLKVFAKPEII
jgi:tRNA pseudouridine55 synthase